MRVLRELMADRWASRGAVGLFGWLLFVNLFVASFTCGMTVPATAGAEAAFVLCEPMRGAAAFAAGHEDAPGFAHDCPCVVGTGGDPAMDLAVAPGADLGAAFAGAEAPVRFVLADDAGPASPACLGLAPPARGPPPLSV